MQDSPFPRAARIGLAAALSTGAAIDARADVITDWNDQANRIVVEAKLGTPPANRVMAMVQAATYEAAGAASPRASLAAAVAAANRSMLMKLLPSQEAAIGAAYQVALATIADGASKTAGIAAGEQATATVLAARADDNAAAAERYRPFATAGAYVPTALPAVPQWPQRKPWLMASAAQFRPAPPPALGSAAWARDYNEVRSLGGKASTQRNAEQTEIARFWEYSLPPIYHGLLRAVALQPGREPLANARLFAAATQAMDDGMIAIFDAKYHYNFWRPATAIRNADIDGNDATEAEAGWAPFIETPMHPEYPSAHSVLAAAVGAVLQAEASTAAPPVLTTSSPSAKGAVRRWRTVDELVQEVANARVWEGVHYRFSTEVGAAMGRQIGALAANQVLRGSLASVESPIPAALAPAGERLVERIAARGVQVYECRSRPGAVATAEWAFVAPEAELVDARGQAAGRHYAGPHWEAPDGSRIVGSVRSRADAPQPDAIPWLLLSARSVGASGRFAGVTSVQRINTSGGTPPARACDASTLGVTERVPYAADYLLYAS